MSYVYFIQSIKDPPLVPVNLDKRINIIKKKATTTQKVNQGQVWSYICYVENFQIG